MPAARSEGLVVGFLILGQMAAGVLVNFVLEAPLFGAPGFLINAAPHSGQIALAALTGLATGAIFVGIAITMFPILNQYSQAAALWLVALATVSLSAAAVENMIVMSMLSLSEGYVKAGAPDRAPFEALRLVVASARNWAHYIGLLIHGGTLFVFYAALYRFALIPRPLAAFGVAAVTLQLVTVAMPLFGHGVVFVLLAPLGLAQLLLALWLIAKGFRARIDSGQRTPAGSASR
jgi:hypothetical protein